MLATHHVATASSVQRRTSAQTVQRTSDRRFCPSIFCFTDELVVQRVTKRAKVWMLSDEQEDRSWLMIGEEPVCPHCGTKLLETSADAG